MYKNSINSIENIIENIIFLSIMKEIDKKIEIEKSINNVGFIQKFLCKRKIKKSNDFLTFALNPFTFEQALNLTKEAQDKILNKLDNAIALANQYPNIQVKEQLISIYEKHKEFNLKQFKLIKEKIVYAEHTNNKEMCNQAFLCTLKMIDLFYSHYRNNVSDFHVDIDYAKVSIKKYEHLFYDV